MKRLNKTESPICALLCVFFCFQNQPFRFLFYFTEAGVKCRVSAVTPPPRPPAPILHTYFTIVQIIFLFPLDHLVHSGYFENRITLKPVLRGWGGGGGGGVRWGVCSLANYIAVYEDT